jgi:hypothetical protein
VSWALTINHPDFAEFGKDVRADTFSMYAKLNVLGY